MRAAVARPQRPDATITDHEVDLADALRRALHLLEPECRRRGVVPELQAPDAVRVIADPVASAAAGSEPASRVHLPSLLAALAIMLVGSVYPLLFANAHGRADRRMGWRVGVVVAAARGGACRAGGRWIHGRGRIFHVSGRAAPRAGADAGDIASARRPSLRHYTGGCTPSA